MTDILNPHKVKALELATVAGGLHAEVVSRAHAYLGFLTGTAAAPAAAATKPAATKPAATKGATADAGTAADPKAGAGTADPKAGAGKPNGATAPKPDPKAGAAAAPKPAAGAAKGANPPSAQSIPADTKAPGGKHTYADVVAMLHKVQNSPAGRPECFKILLDDGGGAKSVRDLKPVHYDGVVEACTNVLSDEGEPTGGGGGGGDALGDLDAISGGPERDEMGL